MCQDNSKLIKRKSMYLFYVRLSGMALLEIEPWGASRKGGQQLFTVTGTC